MGMDAPHHTCNAIVNGIRCGYGHPRMEGVNLYCAKCGAEWYNFKKEMKALRKGKKYMPEG